MARDNDDDASRRAIADARPFVDTLRHSPENMPGSWTRSVLRLWDESGYAGGWARIKDTDLEWHKRVLRQLGLTTAQVVAGQLLPIPE